MFFPDGKGSQTAERPKALERRRALCPEFIGRLIGTRGGGKKVGEERCGTTLDGRIELERDECLKGCLS
jgi:hypothetical protein